MARVVNIYEAKTNLSALVDRAASGEEIIVAKNGKPCARLVPIASKPPKRVPGRFAKDKGFWMAPDFDDTSPDIIALFEGERRK